MNGELVTLEELLKVQEESTQSLLDEEHNEPELTPDELTNEQARIAELEIEVEELTVEAEKWGGEDGLEATFRSMSRSIDSLIHAEENATHEKEVAQARIAALESALPPRLREAVSQRPLTGYDSALIFVQASELDTLRAALSPAPEDQPK